MQYMVLSGQGAQGLIVLDSLLYNSCIGLTVQIDNEL